MARIKTTELKSLLVLMSIFISLTQKIQKHFILNPKGFYIHNHEIPSSGASRL